MSEEKEFLRYSDEDLQEFKEIILEKLKQAKQDMKMYVDALSGTSGNDIADTSPTFKILEEGQQTLFKEETGRLASRLEKYIKNLEAALIRIENKTYGVCRETGELIPKERLKVVPHATLSYDAKINEKKNTK
ncbi:MAG TPA: TraR/DksA C4-type zinc finger protein [Bacteroidales bacterium]|jgi:DnaK suppressor protein|nr:TraR/DksA family transcriptional regulator [Bacteroidales bacterium]HOF16293.1 TraR/DksA C4-type zinc finger protein [Bacteroidales bacterium]HON20328.1 TraR/DksA C4-type zinc finger protein [Bacteroidales bacterium]HOR82609.1 TraR/DksA C4-type zinc finger protein [Bacteroidales bacterium]HPJ91766.1 TraR/DksA C4-type zinc finger protein [Bacteroidales bacterium]